MKHASTYRVGSGLIAGALATSLVIGMQGAHAASAPAVPAPEAVAAAQWLNSTLPDGVIANNTGSTLDFGIALQASGASPAILRNLTDALDTKVVGYTGTDPAKNSARWAKTAYFYAVTGQDVRSATTSNLDLIAPVEAATDDVTGKFSDTWNQSWATAALAITGSPEAKAASKYLMTLQCEDGSFSYSAGCESGDTYATALAVAALASLDGANKVKGSIYRAKLWLSEEQSANGGFENCETYSSDWSSCEKYSENANDTGLAAWALGLAGAKAEAARAAQWVAARQVTSLPGCTDASQGSHGALMWTDSHVATGLNEDNFNTTQVATAQALFALAHLPKQSVKVAAPTGFVAAGSKVTLRLTGLRKGQQACLTNGSTKVAVEGPTARTITAPAKTGVATYRLTSIGATTSTKVNVLAKATLKPSVKAKVKRGKKVTVKVANLAAGEQATIKLGAKRLTTLKANAQGKVSTKVTIPKSTKAGKKKLTVIGQFANRQGSTTIKVAK